MLTRAVSTNTFILGNLFHLCSRVIYSPRADDNTLWSGLLLCTESLQHAQQQCCETRCRGKTAYSSDSTIKNVPSQAVITPSLEQYCPLISSSSDIIYSAVYIQCGNCQLCN